MIAATSAAVRTVTVAGVLLPVMFPCGGMFVYAIPFVVVNSFVVGTPYINLVAIMLPVSVAIMLPVSVAFPWSVVCPLSVRPS